MELVSFPAEDGVSLDAAWYRAREGKRSDRPLVLLTHGAWMNFYTSVPRLLPPFLTRAGFDCLAFNDRDHDLGFIDPAEGRCYGMLRCRFADFLPDLGGALAWAQRQGYGTCALVCHSWSSQRAAYYLSRRGPGPILALAMVSVPPWMQDVSHHWVDDWEALEAEVRRLVAAGRPDEIVVHRAAAPFPIVVSAGTFDDLWLAPSLIDDLSYMQGLTTRLLIVAGEKDQPWLQPTIDKVRDRWGVPAPVAVIPGTGHYYRENPQGLADAVVPFLLDSLPEMKHTGPGTGHERSARDAAEKP